MYRRPPESTRTNTLVPTTTLFRSRPNFLQILAQPQMGISGKNGCAGPYRRERRGKAWLLTPVRDESDSGEEEPPAPRSARRVLRAERIAVGIVRFRKG